MVKLLYRTRTTLARWGIHRDVKPFLIVLLAGCVPHEKGCAGDPNDAEAYAHFLNPKSACYELHRDGTRANDLVVCTIPGEDKWYCTPESCRPLGPPIKMQRVLTAPVELAP